MEEQEIGPGIKIIGFDSVEELMAYQAARKAELAEAMRTLPRAQKEIEWGSYAIKLIPLSEDEDDVLAVFGRIYTEDEYRDLEIAAGSDPVELEYTMRHLWLAYQGGYRPGYWYSSVLPDGEPGDSHVSELWPITEADYQHALNNGWELPLYLQTRIIDEMAEAHREE